MAYLGEGVHFENISFHASAFTEYCGPNKLPRAAKSLMIGTGQATLIANLTHENASALIVMLTKHIENLKQIEQEVTQQENELAKGLA